MKLNKIIEITGVITLESGLHIGTGDSEMHIGGIDSQVVKNPITHHPYIPGSSLKGKIRSLLEWRSGAVKEQPLSLTDWKKNEHNLMVKQILQLFGVSGDSSLADSDQNFWATRLAFWDCQLTEEWKNKANEDILLLSEAKSENTINRITATAAHPRQIERVPAGVKFNFKVTLRQFEGDDPALVDTFLKGLRLLELDSLGGSGSRGYGKIKFENLKKDQTTVVLDTIDPFA